MCDFSLHNVKSRPAKVGDKLTSRDFGTGTRGFAASEDVSVAVCVLPGTELSFADEVRCESLWPWSKKRSAAIRPRSSGRSTETNRWPITTRWNSPTARPCLLTFLTEGQHATVLQLPAALSGRKRPSGWPTFNR